MGLDLNPVILGNFEEILQDIGMLARMNRHHTNPYYKKKIRVPN